MLLARRYDDGGQVASPVGGIGGLAPSVQTMNPMTQGMVQKYAGLPTEKLQEMAAMMGGSAQGKIVQSILQQRMAKPQPQARGGVTRLAGGGSPMGMSASEGTPWWTRSEAAADSRSATGFLHGTTAGRADQIKTEAPAGAYIIPADVIAGLGEGNSLAGARFMQDAISSGPWGTPLPHGGIGSHAPHAPAPPQMAAAGGGLKGVGQQMPVMLSHGEFQVSPEDVMRIGGGDIKHGHKVLDHFVETSRKKQIAKLKKLPGPVKDGK